MSRREFTFFVASLMAIVALSIDAILPAFGYITSDLKVADTNQVQLVVSALFVGLACGQLVCGPLSDAFGRKPVLYVSLVLYLIGTAICFSASTLEGLLLGRVIEGLGVAGPNVTAITLVRDKYSGRQMARIMSMVLMIFIMVPAIAPAIGQVILMFAEWRTIFTLYAVYAVLIALWASARLTETLAPADRVPFRIERLRAGFKEVFANRSTLSLATAVGLTFGCVIGYINSCQQIIQVQFGAGQMFAVYFGLLAALIGVSAFVNARMVERLGMHFMASRGLLTITTAGLIFLLAQSFVTVQLWMFLLFAAALFGCLGFITGNLNSMALEPMGHLAGIATAVVGSVSSLMSLTIGTIIGQLYDGSVLPITASTTLFTFIAWCLLHYAQRQRVAAGLCAN